VTILAVHELTVGNSGSTLVIEAAGILSEKVEKGAYVMLQVKYGLIKLVSTKADLCDQVTNVDMECPIEKGAITITKDVEIPSGVPPVSRRSASRIFVPSD
jgi:hypothetical protein